MNNLRKMTISVSEYTGNATNTEYPDETIVETNEALREVCKHDHIAGAYRNHQRKDASFICTDCIFMDCDNTKSDFPEDWLTPDKVSKKLPDVAFYAVTSRNHNKAKHPGEGNESSARPRHHYYFPLQYKVDDGQVIRNIKQSLLAMLPDMDAGAVSLSQQFFGHDNPVVTYFPGNKDVASFLMEQSKGKKKQSKNPYRETDKPTSLQAQPEFINATIRMILDAIPADDEKMWSAVAVCLYKMGNCSDEYFSAFDQYSQKSSKYKGNADCYKKWKAKARQVANSPHLDFTYLVHLAEEHDSTIKGRLSDIGKRLREQQKPSFPVDTETGEIIPGSDESRPDISDIVKTYDDVEIKETDYLYFPWFPRGKLTLVQGDSGSSKSTFLYAIGAKVTTGDNLLGVPCENPGNVLFITNEDDESDILTSFIDSGGNRDKLFRMTREAISQLDLTPEGADIISEIIEKHDIKLLVLDPIQAFLRGDMNKANETRPQLARLATIAENNNTTIAFIVHMGKDTTKGALHRGIGSVDIGAATRSMLQIVSDPDDDNYKIAFTVKNNTADIREVRKAIRYSVQDHPGSYDRSTGKHHHYHGHAEFSELLPEYSEQAYKKAVRKSQEAEEQAIQLSMDYQADPLVITVRKLVAQNPEGLFIGRDDLIKKITEECRHCPYVGGKSKANGLNNRISAIRAVMMERDAIQMDIQDNSIYPKPYNWKGSIFTPDRIRVKGVYLTPISNNSSDSQQTEM